MKDFEIIRRANAIVEHSTVIRAKTAEEALKIAQDGDNDFERNIEWSYDGCEFTDGFDYEVA